MVRNYSRSDLRALSNDLGAELPAPKPKRKSEEFQLQVALVAWWKGYCVTQCIPEFLLWHTPNSAVYGGSKENRERMGAMLKRLGQRSGVPDIALMVPRLTKESFVCGEYHTIHSGLFIELKSTIGGISPEQKEMLKALAAQGYQTAVCRTLEDAQRVIQDYLR